MIQNLDSIPDFIPLNTEEWSIKTINEICEKNISEGIQIEYKSRYHQLSKEKIEKEILGMANSLGGFLIFGISDKVEKSPIKNKHNEMDQKIHHSIGENIYLVTDSKYIKMEKSNNNVGFYIVKVQESTRKPVLSSRNSSAWKRVESHTHAISREILIRMYESEEQRQEYIRQLELEIKELFQIYNSFLENTNFNNTTKKHYDGNPEDLLLIDASRLRKLIKKSNLYNFGYEDEINVINEDLIYLERKQKKIKEMDYNSIDTHKEDYRSLHLYEAHKYIDRVRDDVLNLIDKDGPLNVDINSI